MNNKGNQPLFEIDGFKVMPESNYIIKNKTDYDAPSAFVKVGTTKLPSAGVGESFQCRYVRTSRDTGVWDTGFYEQSPCYSHLKPGEKELAVKKLMKNVVEPYEAYTGITGQLAHTNDDFCRC